MPRENIRAASRRRFLQYCAASPLLASGALAAEAMEAPSKLPDPMMWAPPGSIDLIKTPKEAINVFDFEPVARKNVPPAHFGYMASGIDDEVTLRANREGRHHDRTVRHQIRFTGFHMPDRRQPVLPSRRRTGRGKSGPRRQPPANALDLVELFRR
jgi:hypothetical protein